MKKRLMSVISILLLGVILFANCLNTNTNFVQIGDTEVPLTANEDINDTFGMTSFSNWRTGNYSLNGNYSENPARICLKDYVSVVAGQEYIANISNSNLHILVRELDLNNKFIKSYDLADKATYTVSASCTKIGISMYDTKNKVVTYDSYKSLFQSGFTATLTLSSNSQQEDVAEEDNELVSGTDKNDVFGMSSFSNWKTGNYNLSGKYTENSARICLKDYVSVVAGQKYTVNISNSNLHILVRELDSNNKFIKSYDLADKATYTVSASCTKIGISMYDTKNKVVSYDSYKTLFQNGFTATLTLNGNDQQDSVEEEDPPFYGSSVDDGELDKNEIVYPNVKAEIIAMIKNGDGTTHDVSKYHMKWMDVNSVFNSVVKNECLLEFECAYGIWISFEKDGDYCKAIKLNGMDSTYKDCLAKSKERIAKVMAGLDDSMTDLDKALYCYDNIVVNTTYSSGKAPCYYGGSILAYNTGACAGIASAYRLLLREAGIDATIVLSGDMNHGWAMLKIDGQWYHADPTWEIHRYSSSGKKTLSRHYFMRNDSEYKGNTLLRRHYNWTVTGGYTSTSTKYTNWFVHDITVPMTYKDGYWYYTDSKTGHSMKAKLDGSDIIDLSK